jgi:hypothetical protein
VYADELHFWGNNINTTNKSTEPLTVGGEVVSQEANTDKVNICWSHQKAGENLDIKNSDSSFEQQRNLNILE